MKKPKSTKGIHIGERRKPQANGKPGYIRIDTVHQGDLDGRKGFIISMQLMKSLNLKWLLV